MQFAAVRNTMALPWQRDVPLRAVARRQADHTVGQVCQERSLEEWK